MPFDCSSSCSLLFFYFFSAKGQVKEYLSVGFLGLFTLKESAKTGCKAGFNSWRPFYGTEANRIAPDVTRQNTASNLGLFCPHT